MSSLAALDIESFLVIKGLSPLALFILLSIVCPLSTLLVKLALTKEELLTLYVPKSGPPWLSVLATTGFLIGSEGIVRLACFYPAL